MSDELKRRAAVAALAELPTEGTIGLGSGSTVAWFIEALALLPHRERYGCVSTSNATRALAERLGLRLLDDVGPWDIAVTVDGADEVDERLDLVKGGGGAHTREKIVNRSSRRNVIVVDESKRVRQLGVGRAVPIEVLAMGHGATAQHLGRHGTVRLRLAGEAPFRTDNGNLVYDLACGPIADARALDVALHAIPGVIETGLFIAACDVLYVGTPSAVIRVETS